MQNFLMLILVLLLSASSSSAQNPPSIELKVLTLNTWLFPVKPIDTQRFPTLFSVDNVARRALIAHEVEEQDIDIVAFQEVWGSDNIDSLTALMNERGYHCADRFRAWPLFLTAGTGGSLSALGAYETVRRGVTRRVGGLAPKRGAMEKCASLLRNVAFAKPSRILTRTGAGVSAGVFATAEYIEQEMGNGLLICSRFPILGQPLSMNYDRLSYSTEDELLAAKGGLWVRTEVPGFGPVDVVTTHTEARHYDARLGRFADKHTRVNTDQIRQLIRWVRQTEKDLSPKFGPKPLQVLLGDFNFTYEVIRDGKWSGTRSDPYVRITRPTPKAKGWRDTYVEANGDGEPRGYTVSKANQYEGPKRGNASPEEVTDYIFVSEDPEVEVTKSEVVCKATPDPVVIESLGLEGSPKQLADHFGVKTTLRLNRRP